MSIRIVVTVAHSSASYPQHRSRRYEGYVTRGYGLVETLAGEDQRSISGKDEPHTVIGVESDLAPESPRQGEDGRNLDASARHLGRADIL